MKFKTQFCRLLNYQDQRYSWLAGPKIELVCEKICNWLLRKLILMTVWVFGTVIFSSTSRNRFSPLVQIVKKITLMSGIFHALSFGLLVFMIIKV